MESWTSPCVKHFHGVRAGMPLPFSIPVIKKRGRMRAWISTHLKLNSTEATTVGPNSLRSSGGHQQLFRDIWTSLCCTVKLKRLRVGGKRTFFLSGSLIGLKLKRLLPPLCGYTVSLCSTTGTWTASWHLQRRPSGLTVSPSKYLTFLGLLCPRQNGLCNSCLLCSVALHCALTL